MQFVIMAEHQPQFCPTSNSKIRQIMSEAKDKLPALAEKLGVRILTLRVFGGDHIVLGIVESKDIENVRNFIMESGLVQWNTVKIYATWSLEEALERASKLPALF